MVINSRKRMRSESDEQHFTIQSKHFISEQTVNSHDTNKMKQIHGKFVSKHPNNNNPTKFIANLFLFQFFSHNQRKNDKDVVSKRQSEGKQQQ